MDDDSETRRRHDFWGVAYGERLLIWALRRIVFCQAPCPLVAREFADACGADGAQALATFRVLLDLLGRSARRRLSIGQPGCHGITPDERQLVSLVAAAQAGDQPRLDALLCWVVRGELRRQVAVAVRALAAAFAAHDLVVASVRTATPAEMPASRDLRLVS